MKNLRVLFVGVIACFLLITLSVSCDADQSADIQKIEDFDNQKLNKDEIDDDDI